MGTAMCDGGRPGVWCGFESGGGSESWEELTVIVGLAVWVNCV